MVLLKNSIQVEDTVYCSLSTRTNSHASIAAAQHAVHLLHIVTTHAHAYVYTHTRIRTHTHIYMHAYTQGETVSICTTDPCSTLFIKAMMTVPGVDLQFVVWHFLL